MRDSLEAAQKILVRTSAIFSILWVIAALTDLLGRYEHEQEFLQLAVLFLMISRIPAAFKAAYSYGEKFKKLFQYLGLVLVGLWCTFRVLRWVGWFGPVEIGVNIDYLLIGGIITFLAGGIFEGLHKLGISAIRKWKSATPKTPKTKSVRCPQCRKRIEKNWISCPYCGYNLKDDTRIY